MNFGESVFEKENTFDFNELFNCARRDCLICRFEQIFKTFLSHVFDWKTNCVYKFVSRN